MAQTPRSPTRWCCLLRVSFCSSAALLERQCRQKVKQHQSEIFHFLDSKKIKYFAVDITESTDLKEEMRKKVGNPSAMPPQVFNGDKYCGDYQKFFDAVEDGKPEAFFKL